MSQPIPVRMVNEVVYFARLFALEHLNGEWAESADTIRGRTVHRRVDRPSSKPLPAAEPPEAAPPQVRSVTLGCNELGLVGKLDLLEVDGTHVVPVDYKKGRVPDVPEHAYLPERVQVCAQGLLLRANGFHCDHAVLYFAESRRRVEVRFTDELIAETRKAIERAKAIVASGRLPEPLIDSPKCWGCSLVGLCLPDEHNVLNGRTDRVRMLAPKRDEGVPLYVEHRGAKLAKSGGEIVVKADGREIERVRMSDTSRVVVTGAASVTTPLLQALAAQDTPLSVHGWSNHVVGSFLPVSGHNVLGRMAQHRMANDARRSLAIAGRIVSGKVANQRVFLRRNAGYVDPDVLEELRELSERALRVSNLNELYGVEGRAARRYFEHFDRMLKSEAIQQGFDFEGRNRRPPKDPVNALLSLSYAFLVREVTSALVGVGLDAWVGFLHRPRPGKPALALDLMEEFRPVLADSVVVGALNNGTLGRDDFHVGRLGTTLLPTGRKAFIRAFERRMAQQATHPRFATRMSYRRILEVQARLLCKTVLEEIPTYPSYRIR
ncbi:MAG: CRISPR-associated endonuclease Cas1 [Myxococcota bacterium]